MTQPLFIVALIGLVSIIATETIVYWHRATRGSWRNWPAGRSLMYLLAIIATGFGFGVLNQFLGQYALRPAFGFVLYLAFIAALVIIRITIAAEMRRGRRQKLTTTLPTPDGAVDVTVATTNKESSHD
jgi:uncharacterized membrane protein YfcA